MFHFFISLRRCRLSEELKRWRRSVQVLRRNALVLGQQRAQAGRSSSALDALEARHISRCRDQIRRLLRPCS